MEVKKKRGSPKGSTNKNKTRVKPVTPESPAAKKLSQRSRLLTTPSQRRVTTFINFWYCIIWLCIVSNHFNYNYAMA